MKLNGHKTYLTGIVMGLIDNFINKLVILINDLEQNNTKFKITNDHSKELVINFLRLKSVGISDETCIKETRYIFLRKIEDGSERLRLQKRWNDLFEVK